MQHDAQNKCAEVLEKLKKLKADGNVGKEEAVDICREGMQTTRELMKEHHTSQMVVLQALSCLQEIENLSLSLSLTNKVHWSAEMCDIALRHHGKDEVITMTSLRLLSGLCRNPFVARLVVTKSSALSRVFEAVHSLPNSKAIVRESLSFLSVISRYDSCISALQSTELIRLLECVHSNHKTDVVISENVAFILGNLVQYPDMLAALVAHSLPAAMMLHVCQNLYPKSGRESAFELAYKICWSLAASQLPAIPPRPPKVACLDASTIEVDPDTEAFFPEASKNGGSPIPTTDLPPPLVQHKNTAGLTYSNLPNLDAEDLEQPAPFHNEGFAVRKALMRKELDRLVCSPTYSIVFDCFQSDLGGAETGGSLCFESRFESGNLRRSIKVSDNEYDLFLSEDINDLKSRSQWYYFCVSRASPGTAYKFNIVNLKKSTSVYNQGLKPLCFTANKGKGGIWRRVGSNIAYYPSPYCRWAQQCLSPTAGNSKGAGAHQKHNINEALHMLTFTITFEHEGRHFLSMCYPFTYTDLQHHLGRLESAVPGASESMHRTMLCKTLSGQVCDLVTITEMHEDCTLIEERPFVLMTARVHPGETNSSWLMKGFLDFLVSMDPLAVLLRRSFVFKVVPMLNPDGVINGCYRCNLAGVDLNRQWSSPNARHPTIFRTRSLLQQLKERGPVALYVDLHGHSRKMDAFTFACEPSQQRRNCLPFSRERVRIFPLLLSKRNQGFNLANCTYKVLQAKEGAARVTAATELGVSNSYTLEASMAGSSAGYHFTRQDYETLGRDIGKALGDSLLESEEDLMRDVAEALAVKKICQHKQARKNK